MSWRRRFGVTLLLVSLLIGSVAVAVQGRTVQFAVYASPERVPLYEAFFAAFTERTGIEVDFLQVSQGQVTKWEQIITRIAGGVSPDVVGAVSVEFVQYAAIGLIQPLNVYLAMDGQTTDDIVPVLSSALQWQGQQYLMPYGASGVTMAYNPLLFDEAGLLYPPDMWADPAWTWDAFLDSARRLTRTDGEGAPTQFGVAGPFMDGWFTIPYTWGGDWISPDLTTFTGTEPEALEALQAFQDLRWTYHVMPQPGEVGGGLAGFLNGTSAMGGFGTWNLENLVQSELPVTLMPWFAVGEHLAGPINPIGLAMLSSAPNTAEAWEFIKFATLDPVGNYLYAKAAGAIPGVIGEAQQRWLAELTDQAPQLNPMAFLQQVAEYPGIVNIRKLTTFNEINTVMSDAVNNVLNNTTSPRVAMDEVAPIVQMLIDMSEH